MTFATLSASSVVVILLAVAVGASLQRLCGMGVGLVVAPTLSILLGPVLGVALTNATTVVSASVIGAALWRDADRRRLAVILPVAVLGALPGALLVREVSTPVLNVIVGATVCLGLAMTGIVARLDRLPHVTSRWPAAAAGIAGAFLNTAAGVAAPAMVIYAALSRWDQRSFAASLQFTFLTMSVLSVGLKIAVGATPLDTLPDPRVLGGIVVTVLAAVFVAGRLSRRVPASAARKLAIALASTGALITLVRGIVALAG